MFTIREDDLSSEQTRRLLALHLAGMQANSPAESVFALDLTALQDPRVTVWSAWDGDTIASIGAIKALGDGTAEVKSMRTAPGFERRGAAARILETIINEARSRGYRDLYLETGSGSSFEPALTLYRKRGFASCGAFSDYEASDFNQFLRLELESAG